MPLSLRLLQARDDAILTRIAPGVFDHAVRPEWAAEFLNDPRHHLVAALDGNTVVGFASALHYLHPDKPPELWINEVGVAESHRGRGIAAGILGRLLEHGRSLGCVQAWVLTAPDNAAANALYRSAGGVAAGELSVMYEFDLNAGLSRQR